MVKYPSNVKGTKRYFLSLLLRPKKHQAVLFAKPLGRKGYSEGGTFYKLPVKHPNK